jgi:hypothetical protein
MAVSARRSGGSKFVRRRQVGRPVTATDKCQKLVKRWQHCTEVGGDYVEK